MPIYKIPVSYEMCGLIEVEADSIKEAIEYAIEHADDYDLPNEEHYIDGSWQTETDEEIVELYNRKS